MKEVCPEGEMEGTSGREGKGGMSEWGSARRRMDRKRTGRARRSQEVG
jgi:hypothetical protein